MNRTLEVMRLPDPVAYSKAMAVQDERRAAVENGLASNALFLLEHQPVVTLGRRAHKENLLADPAAFKQHGIEVCETTRGGDVTYHGPGQLVAYPILDLANWKKSIRWYLGALEEILIRQLEGYGLAGHRIENLTGVWVSGEKVAAIGIAIHNWVTFHGVALNVDPDLSHFDLIVPCGIPGRRVTSLKKILGNAAPSLAQAMNDFESTFRTLFRVRPCPSVSVQATETEDNTLGEWR